MKTYILWAAMSSNRWTDTIVSNERVAFCFGYKRARFSDTNNEVGVSETLVTLPNYTKLHPRNLNKLMKLNYSLKPSSVYHHSC
jgi:hypothetical protein